MADNSIINILKINFSSLSLSQKVRIKELGRPTPELNLHQPDTGVVVQFLKKRFEIHDANVSNFGIVGCRSYYVDKTMLIKAVLENTSSRIVITAPRRFGKSTNMDMLRKFFEIQIHRNGDRIQLKMDGTELKTEQTSPNFKLFEDKKIFQHQEIFKQHFGRYPVIHVDFKGLTGNTYESSLLGLGAAVSNSFSQHAYLRRSMIWATDRSERTLFRKYIAHGHGHGVTLSTEEILIGLRNLSRYLFQHFNNNVFVFIDEYDAPISTAVYNKGTAESLVKIAQLMREFISNLLVNNPYVERAFMTGCHHFGGVFSPNNILHVPFLQSETFCQFYGFTEDETTKVLTNHGFSEKLVAIEDWYKGYKKKLDNGNCVEIYSSWSILSYMYEKRTWDVYGQISLYPYRPLLRQNNILQKLKCVMAQKVVEIKYIKMLTIDDVIMLKRIIATPTVEVGLDDVDLFFLFLYEGGYLNLVTKTDRILSLEIPNKENYFEFWRSLFSIDFITEYYNFDMQSIKIFKEALKDAAKNKEQESFLQLANSIKNLFNIRIPEYNFELHAILLFLMEHEYCSNGIRIMDGKHIRSDVIVIIQDESEYACEDIETGIIVESRLGSEGDSVSALNHILNIGSYNVFENAHKFFNETYSKTIDDKIFIGLHMTDDTQISLTYLVNSFDRSLAKTVCSSPPTIGF